MIAIDRKLLLHPAVSSRLQAVQDKLPPYSTTLIQAAALYGDPDIPWEKDEKRPEVHFIAVAGRPESQDYLYDLAAAAPEPRFPGELSGIFSLEPAEPTSASIPSSVIGRLQTTIDAGSFTPDQALAVIAGFLREIYGTLKPPWDDSPGIKNDHDLAATARAARDMPALSAVAGRYLQADNLLDESADRSGPYVLVNVQVRLRDGALDSFPRLRGFYRSLTNRVTGQMIVRDEQGHNWLRLGFNNGYFHIVFLLRQGEPAPFDDQFKPCGPPMALTTVQSGQFTTDTSVWVTRLGMRFGLAHLRYTTAYRHRGDAIFLVSRMAAVPQVLAPPVLHSLVLLFAGPFMRTLAKGNSGRGMEGRLAAVTGPDGGMLLSVRFDGEFLYSPSLELLARVGDAIARANNQSVREDERRLLGRFLHAAHTDFLRALPALVGPAPMRASR